MVTMLPFNMEVHILLIPWKLTGRSINGQATLGTWWKALDGTTTTPF